MTFAGWGRSSGLSYVHQPVDDNPTVRGNGPLMASTSTALSIRPVWIYDVNGYYRDLGIDPNSRPTRKDLRLAYFEKDGQSSERLTYVMKQLLDPVIRDAYDTCLPGETFLDKYVAEEIERKVRDMALKRMAEEGLDLLDNDALREEQAKIYDEMGLNDDSLNEDLDQWDPEAEDAPRPATFGFAYFLWRTRIRDDRQSSTLGDWQALLVSEFSKRKVQIKFAVGFHGRMAQPWLLARVSNREVFFLHHLETPTPELAHALVETWIRENQSTTPSLETR